MGPFLRILQLLSPLGLLLGMLGTARADSAPVLLELFTSEGCSSCPPADRLLARLAGEGSAAGVPIIALEWHVDYWNDLGWIDPFSTVRAHTERQQQYARALGSGRVYTPQLVIDGRADVVGSNEAQLRVLIEKAGPAAKARIELAIREKPQLQLSISLKELPKSLPQPSPSSAETIELWMAITERGLLTAVPRGENAGRTLTHGPIVRHLRKLGRLETTPFQLNIDLPIEKSWHREQLSVVVFLQRSGSGHIMGAAQVALPHRQ